MKVLLAIYLVSIVLYVIGIICVLTTAAKAKNEGATVKEYSNSNFVGWCRFLLVMVCPILNLLVGITCICVTEELVNRLMQ